MRDTRISIMVDEQIKVRLGELAGAMGLKTSSLCAFVLGQYVAQQDTLIRPMLDRLGIELAEMTKSAAESIDQGNE
jgi:predicted transcriptional regulator